MRAELACIIFVYAFPPFYDRKVALTIPLSNYSAAAENPILCDLNQEQTKAVTAPISNLLVLAGAGSGKTRVLVHRLAWLIDHYHVNPHEILAMTFTNKAAGEMKRRTAKLLNASVKSMWIGTFHSMAYRLLRKHHREAGLPESFEILDADDQIRLVRRIIRQMELTEHTNDAREMAQYINRWKDDGLRPQDLENTIHARKRTPYQIYIKYQEICEKRGLVDFGDLLLRSHELWLNHKEILEHYRSRFRHILIDEFQDTNLIQYAWLTMVAGSQNKVMVVGDDDQSIYGWRGAQITNIRRFASEYTAVQTIKLEQNYRSTQVILNAANAVIKNNPSRLGKTLWTQAAEGELIKGFKAANGFDEADFVAQTCQHLLDTKGYSPNQIAVLYRNNAQSRLLEQIFNQRAMPFIIHGGTRFYDRLEVRNALAYMRLIQNPNANSAFERVVNVPSRGIGSRTLETIRATAAQNNISNWDAAKRAIENKLLPTRADRAIKTFIALIEKLTQLCQGKSLADVANVAVRVSGLYEFHGSESSELARMRTENLDELLIACDQFALLDTEAEQDEIDQATVLRDFLDRATLDAGDYQNVDNDSINLMTLHSAKGLEFPVVFVTGLEEDLFPHYLVKNDPDREEEERRLAYVGITRAMERLYLTFADTRATSFQQRETKRTPSRYLREIPTQYLSWVGDNPYQKERPLTCDDIYVRSPIYLNNTAQYYGSSRITHKKLGPGRVTNTRGESDSKQVEIEFSDGSRKWFLESSSFLVRE